MVNQAEQIKKSVPITAFITNMGKYNEGELIGEWLHLPTTTEKLHSCLTRIGVDGVFYQKYFIPDYETSIKGLQEYLPKRSDLDELNYLAARLKEMNKDDLEKYEATIGSGKCTSSVKDLINLTGNLKGDRSYEEYNGQNMPEQYRIFSYPEFSSSYESEALEMDDEELEY